jgi:hypothetical protein
MGLSLSLRMSLLAERFVEGLTIQIFNAQEGTEGGYRAPLTRPHSFTAQVPSTQKSHVGVAHANSVRLNYLSFKINNIQIKIMFHVKHPVNNGIDAKL